MDFFCKVRFLFGYLEKNKKPNEFSDKKFVTFASNKFVIENETI